MWLFLSCSIIIKNNYRINYQICNKIISQYLSSSVIFTNEDFEN